MHCRTLDQSDSTPFSSGAELVNSSFPCYFEAIMTENRIYAEDAQNDPRTSELTETYLKPLGITSILDSGIIIEGYLRGVVCSEHLGPIRQWHPDEEAFLSTVAAMVCQVSCQCRAQGRRRRSVRFSRPSSSRRRRWCRWADWPGAWPMTSTTCWGSFWATLDAWSS